MGFAREIGSRVRRPSATITGKVGIVLRASDSMLPMCEFADHRRRKSYLGKAFCKLAEHKTGAMEDRSTMR